MAAICFTLLCTSFPIALWKENKDSLYVGKWLLCGNCHHKAAISKFKMATTLLDMQFSKRDRCRLHCQLSLRKLLYLHFVQMALILKNNSYYYGQIKSTTMAAIFNFTMTAALPVIFSVIERTKIHVHVS